MKSWVWENEEMTEKCGGKMHCKHQLHEEDKNASEQPQIVNPCYTFTQQDQNEFPTMEEMEKIAKIMKENAQELQLRERAKLINEQ